VAANKDESQTMFPALMCGIVLLFSFIDLYLALVADQTGIFLGFFVSVVTSYLACRYYPMHLLVVRSLFTSLAVGFGSLTLAWLWGFVVSAAV
jgi:hypothetical protein